MTFFLRWSTHIFSFNFKALHRKGKIHLNEDILSRDETILDQPSESDAAETNIHTLASMNTLCGISDYNVLNKISICENVNCKICVIEKSHIPLSNKNKFDILKHLSLSKIMGLSQIDSNFTHSLTLKQFSNAQKMDRVLSEVGQWIIDKKTDKNQLYDEELMYLAEHYDDIILKDDILYIKLSGNTEYDTLFGNPLKMLVPLALVKR